MKGAAAVLAALLLWLAPPAAAHQDFVDLAWRPHPGAVLPLAAELQDETGGAGPLARWFTGRPVVLVLQYLHCRDLCGVTLKNLFAALPAPPHVPTLIVSIDPGDGPAAIAAAKRQYGRGADPDVHFLTGAPAAVARLAETVGFAWRRDAKTGEYVHPAGFVVAAGDGRISRYFLGVAVSTAALREALADAAQGRAAGPLYRLLLLCHLGSATGRWTTPVEAAFAAANLAAIAGAVAIFALIRRRRHG